MTYSSSLLEAIIYRLITLTLYCYFSSPLVKFNYCRADYEEDWLIWFLYSFPWTKKDTVNFSDDALCLCRWSPNHFWFNPVISIRFGRKYMVREKEAFVYCSFAQNSLQISVRVRLSITLFWWWSCLISRTKQLTDLKW